MIADEFLPSTLADRMADFIRNHQWSGGDPVWTIRDIIALTLVQHNHQGLTATLKHADYAIDRLAREIVREFKLDDKSR